MIEEIKKEIEQYSCEIRKGCFLISKAQCFKILDKYNNQFDYKKIIIEIECYLNHLNNTKAIYNQKQIADYILEMIIKFNLKEVKEND